METRKLQLLLSGTHLPETVGSVAKGQAKTGGKHVGTSFSKKPADKSASAGPRTPPMKTVQQMQGVTTDERFSGEWRVSHQPAVEKQPACEIKSWSADYFFSLPWTAEEGVPSMHAVAKRLGVDVDRSLAVHKQCRSKTHAPLPWLQI